MSGRIAVCTKSPLTGTVTDSHHGGWSGARLEWAGFDGADDSLPGRFVEGDDEAIPGQRGSEGEPCELAEMKAEYYDHRGRVDGVVTDETLERLDIEAGPGPGVSGSGGQAPADD